MATTESLFGLEQIRVNDKVEATMMTNYLKDLTNYLKATATRNGLSRP